MNLREAKETFGYLIEEETPFCKISEYRFHETHCVLIKHGEDFKALAEINFQYGVCNCCEEFCESEEEEFEVAKIIDMISGETLYHDPKILNT